MTEKYELEKKISIGKQAESPPFIFWVLNRRIFSLWIQSNRAVSPLGMTFKFILLYPCELRPPWREIITKVDPGLTILLGHQEEENAKQF